MTSHAAISTFIRDMRDQLPVEARHAAEVRRLRGNFTDTEPFHQGWITGNQTDVPGASAVYAGEDNTTHLGINVTGVTPVAVKEVTEARST